MASDSTSDTSIPVSALSAGSTANRQLPYGATSTTTSPTAPSSARDVSTSCSSTAAVSGTDTTTTPEVSGQNVSFFNLARKDCYLGVMKDATPYIDWWPLPGERTKLEGNNGNGREHILDGRSFREKRLRARGSRPIADAELLKVDRWRSVWAQIFKSSPYVRSSHYFLKINCAPQK